MYNKISEKIYDNETEMLLNKALNLKGKKKYKEALKILIPIERNHIQIVL